MPSCMCMSLQQDGMYLHVCTHLHTSATLQHPCTRASARMVRHAEDHDEVCASMCTSTMVRTTRCCVLSEILPSNPL